MMAIIFIFLFLLFFHRLNKQSTIPPPSYVPSFTKPKTESSSFLNSSKIPPTSSTTNLANGTVLKDSNHNPVLNGGIPNGKVQFGLREPADTSVSATGGGAGGQIDFTSRLVESFSDMQVGCCVLYTYTFSF